MRLTNYLHSVLLLGTTKTSLILSLSMAFMGCGNDEPDPAPSAGGDWLIPFNEVRDGGPGKDGIPALTNPEFIDVGQATYLNDIDLVVGYKSGNEVRAYPHKIFDWHEIINDDLSGRKVAITHCPLTGTSLGWEREYDGKTTTFGVSGLLYNTNLMPYDRTTNSTWTQIGELCVNGELSGTMAETFQIFETEWGTWKTLYPETKVVSTNTGHSRNYGQYPYGDYRTANGLIFSVSVDDNRLPQKERVHGIIIDKKVKVYRFNSMTQNPLITDTFQGQNLTIVGSPEKNFIISFKEKMIGSTVLSFNVINDFNSPIILEDQLGNKWDVFGHATSGPNAGEKLEPTNSFIGMFFSWAPFYGLPEIYNN
ncbi:MAG: DUF3179 domain-containing protein [Cyclobacteriaceae bacterium]